MRHVQLWDSQHVYRMDDGPAGKWTPVLWKAWPSLEEVTEKGILEIGGIEVKGHLTGHI